MKSLYVFNSLEITDLDHIQREISRGLFQTLCIQHSFKSRDGNSLFDSTMNIRILYGKDFQIRYLNHQRCIMLSRGWFVVAAANAFYSAKSRYVQGLTYNSAPAF